MTLETTTAPMPVAQNVARPDRSTAWLCGAFICLAFAHAPLLYWHLCSILAKPHYQFVILLPVAVGALVWQRWKDINEIRPGSLVLTYVFGTATLGMLGMATKLWSPWLGAVAATLSVLVVIYAYGGGKLVKHLFPAWLMLWFAVALPLDLDNLLIQSLREYATTWTGAVLDWLGIRHLVEGNVIEVPDRSFFVADACTGIHSLFVVAAMAVFVGFWNGRRVHQVLVLLICAFGLVLLENISRLVGVVAICEWGVDVSTGWRHKALGGAVFIATLGLLISADQLVSFAIPERLLFFWPGRDNSVTRGQRKEVTVAYSEHSWHVLTPLLVCFIAVGIWQVVVTPAGSPKIAETFSNPFEPLASLPADAMPAQIGQWTQKDHEFVRREVEDPQGQYSHIWTFERQGQTVQIAVDYPFPAIHDACLCFENTGWTIERQKMLEDPASDAGMVEARLSKAFTAEMYLLSCFFNTRGEFGTMIYPRENLSSGERLASRLDSFVSQQTDAGPPGTKIIQGPVCQVRMAANFRSGLADAETEHLIEFFRTTRVLLERSCAEQLQSVQ